MGICSSCESVSIATAKLILQNGNLVEFPYSVKVSCILQKYPSCFICNSDSMEFEDFVSAMHADEELLPGHLYFALPLSRLRYPLQPEEMAALAVKASLALMKRSDAYGSQMLCDKEQERRRSSADGYSIGGGMRKKSSKRPSCCKGSGRQFTAKTKLVSIPEIE